VGPLLGGFLHDHFGFNVTFYAGAAILLMAIVIVQFGVERVATPAVTSLPGDPQAPRVRVLNGGLLSAAGATFLMASAFTLMTTLENEFNARLHINAFHFAIAFSTLMLSRLMFQIPLGRLSDRFGRRPFVIAGLLLIGPVTVLLGEVANLWQFVGLRFVQGMAAGAIVAPALAYAGDMAQSSGQGRHGVQMSIVTTGFGLGIAFGPLIAGFLGAVSFELPFWIDGVMCIIGAFFVYLFMTEAS
jgi:MFS family permease